MLLPANRAATKKSSPLIQLFRSQLLNAAFLRARRFLGYFHLSRRQAIGKPYNLGIACAYIPVLCR